MSTPTATRIAPTDLAQLRSTPIGDFCAFTTVTNKAGIVDVLIKKPQLRSMPTLLKRETDRDAYVLKVSVRLNQKALVHRDFLVAELAKSKQDDKVLKKHLRALAQLQAKGVDLKQLDFSVGMNQPGDMTDAEWKKAKEFRLNLTHLALLGARELRNAFLKDETFTPTPDYVDICKLVEEGLVKNRRR